MSRSRRDPRTDRLQLRSEAQGRTVFQAIQGRPSARDPALKVLFDQNAPRPAIRFLSKHVVTRLAELGWEEVKNGDLLDAAEKEGFEVIVTCERNLKYPQNFSGRSTAILVLPSGRWPVVHDQMDEVVTAMDEATPGTYREIA